MSNILQPQAAPSPDTKEAEARYAELKKKAGRFRVLIIGGANAGKTTILKKICNTTENPEIYNKWGRKIKSNLEPTGLRGNHTIENEMVFRSNPTFIFHDSCGFEAGGVDEFVKVKKFVSDRGEKESFGDQIHVIWYCIAMDDDRPITHAERDFFSKSGTGKVPVVVIFTKCEALELKAIAVLEDKGYDFDEAVEKAPAYVERELKNVHQTMETMKYCPKGHVYLQELEKPEKDCGDLVQCTVKVLDNNVLQGLFIATQQNCLVLAIKQSLRQQIKF
ncbi:GTP-binding protein [Collybia nuda]|uniref:GTP-binding protein n=1 Tax=Collybia nuda TaxID=64659 RepID=A0A9P6CGW2_9AGAR|nr:GTP-binding protein [Collybia nuda]